MLKLFFNKLSSVFLYNNSYFDAITMQDISGYVIVALLVLLAGFLILSIMLAVRNNKQDYKYRKYIHKLTYYDRLTLLPNWAKMKLELENAVSGSLITFDVKSFKLYNELFGHAYGDELLRNIGTYLAKLQTEKTFVCRYQSDCFALFVPISGEPEIKHIMRKTFEDLQLQNSKHKISMRFACGVVTLNISQKETASVLQDCADFARNMAKRSAKTEIVFFDSQAKSDMIELQTLTGQLDEATLQGDFIVAYQPQFSLSNNSMIGAEALIRWQHPERGLLMPDTFVPAFIENGSIERIDQYILEKVLQQLAAWKKSGIPLVPIAINLSRAQFLNRDMAKNLAQQVTDMGIPTSLIVLEITESSLFGDIDLVIENMHELKHYGFAIAMDDFGSGYSSLGLLRNLPFDTIKLDKSLLSGIEGSGRQQVFLGDIISLAHHMGISVLIEGVESEIQANIMKIAGCDYAQGFCFSHPLTPDNFFAALTNSNVANKLANNVQILPGKVVFRPDKTKRI